jgi:preprotein translocase subunit SecF
MRILANQNFNFIRWRWHAIVLSVLIILTGVWTIVSRGGLPLGIDFSGGTIIELQFSKPVSEEAVRNALAPVVKESVVQQIGQPGQNRIMVRLPMAQGTEQGASLEEGAKQVQEAIRAANLGDFKPENVEIVGPVIGDDLQRKGIYATIFSLLGIMTYIALRFRLSFGVGAAVASVHDVLVTLSILTLAGYELSLNVIAAILTLTGYGVNDQIVVFDRVRENLRLNRKEPMDVIINQSVNQTLPRTVITAGVTFLAVLALYLFGGEVLRGFSFTMLVGIITSTYSTIYIASAVAVVLSPQRLRAGTAAGAAQKGAPVKTGSAAVKTGGAPVGSKSSRRSS